MMFLCHQNLVTKCLLLLSMNFAAGAGIDLSSLSIVEGKVCWDLYIDGLVVSSDGNVLDAFGAAIKVHSFSSYAFINCHPI